MVEEGEEGANERPLPFQDAGHTSTEKEETEHAFIAVHPNPEHASSSGGKGKWRPMAEQYEPSPSSPLKESEVALPEQQGDSSTSSTKWNGGQIA